MEYLVKKWNTQAEMRKGQCDTQTERNVTQRMPAQQKSFFCSPYQPTEETANCTGIPSSIKRKSEQISGFSFDDVRIHYNSEKPAQLQALAYTQGNQVFVAPGQRQHLPHELGHVIQQKRGEVESTMQLGGIPINDDQQMENEADYLGSRIL